MITLLPSFADNVISKSKPETKSQSKPKSKSISKP